MKKRLLCLILAVVMCFTLLPVLGSEAHAVESQQRQLAEAALAHVGDTANDFPNVKFDWCVYFTTCCANEIGIAGTASSPRSKIFPPVTDWKENDWAATGVTYQANWFTKYSHGKLYYFKDSKFIDKNINAFKTNATYFEPIPGDLIYIDHPQNNSIYDHVAIVYDYDEANRVVYYVGGNQGNNDWKYSSVSCREINLGSSEIAGFLRPNYTTSYINPANSTVGISNCTYGAGCPSRSFTDVTEASWFHNSLDYCVDHNLFKGTSNTLFSPNATMTRGMMITVLYRLDGCPDITGLANPFSDVSNGTWCVDAIKWAYAAGVTEGYANNTFGTDIKITRAQAAKMLYCFALYKGLDCSKIGDYSGYSDANQVGEWAAPAMKWSIGNGIILGVSASRLNPNGNATRAQLATILARYAQYYDIFSAAEEEPVPSATPEPTESVESVMLYAMAALPTAEKAEAEGEMKTDDVPIAEEIEEESPTDFNID